MLKKVLIGIGLLSLAVGCGLAVVALLGKFSDEVVPDVIDGDIAEEVVEQGIFGDFYAAAEKKLAEMSSAEKVGQLFLVRFAEESIEGDLASGEPAGYILFTKDFRYETPASIRQKLQSYQELSKTGLIFGVDEEGGLVVRVSRYSAFRAKAFASPAELWNAGGAVTVAADAAEKSQLLRSLGINMNLAPVADVSVNPADFIYERALGRNATETAEYVATVVTQMKADGMISVMKHFPGYGNNADTHTGVAVDERGYETFLAEDFLPFQAGIAAGGPSVLVSHNVIMAVDAEYPASLSKKVHDILREDLDFSGVIMTDDLAMDAVRGYVTDGRAAVLAVLAGNDLIITSSYAEHKQEVLAAAESGEIPEEVINSAARRVLALKMAYRVAKNH